MYSKNAYPHLKDNLFNGISLCQKHHKDYHNTYGYGNNSSIQFFCWIQELYKDGQISDDNFASIKDQIMKLKQQLKGVINMTKLVNATEKEIYNGGSIGVTKFDEKSNKENVNGLIEVYMNSHLNEKYIKVETSLPEGLYNFFKKYCDRYNLTMSQALQLLIEIERSLVLDKRKNSVR